MLGLLHVSGVWTSRLLHLLDRLPGCTGLALRLQLGLVRLLQLVHSLQRGAGARARVAGVGGGGGVAVLLVLAPPQRRRRAGPAGLLTLLLVAGRAAGRGRGRVATAVRAGRADRGGRVHRGDAAYAAGVAQRAAAEAAGQTGQRGQRRAALHAGQRRDGGGPLRHVGRHLHHSAG